MKYFTHLFFIIVLSTSVLKAYPQLQQGDTIFVRAHNSTDMTWYGNYDALCVFPDTSIEFRKITMKYTMGCASSGCSDWDYTTKVELLHNTGVIDSSQYMHMWFTVDDGCVLIDTMLYSIVPTYKTSWNLIDNVTDTIWNLPVTVLFYDSTTVPPVVYDSMYVYMCDYWNYFYDATGQIVDSIFVPADDTLINVPFYYYLYFTVLEPLELARVITPYGGFMRAGQHGFNNSWTFVHEFDVTDFSNLLRDSVKIRAFYDGWSSGFSITLDFEMIVGKPARDVVKIKNLWRGGFPYINSTSFEQNYLPPHDQLFTSEEKTAMLRVIPTGHGFDNNVNCAEFCPRTYYLKINDTQVDSRLIWDDNCGFNPIYPQAGTWIYNRANWCPGLAARIFEHNLTPYISHSDTVVIDIDMQDYTWSGSQTPYYYIDAQLITYGEPYYNIDAEVYDIITPSLKDEYMRLNPICQNPTVVIRNSGANDLNSLTIEYGIKGQTPQIYTWTGVLSFLEKETVILSPFIFDASMMDLFYVSVSNPNGQADENPLNDYMETPFNLPDEIDEIAFIVELRTNNAAWQNQWKIFDTDGNIIAERANLTNSTTYLDTVFFENNKCYVFELTDAGGNGLSFFANNEGTGFLRFRKAFGTGLVKSFNANFGSKIVYPFRISSTASVKSENPFDFYIYPNPAANEFFVEVPQAKVEDIFLQTVCGRMLEVEFFNEGMNRYVINVTGLSSGIYFVSVLYTHSIATKKIIVK